MTPKYLLWALTGVATAGLVLFVLWGGPWLFTQHPPNALTAEQELKAQNDVRTTLVQAVAGLAVASGAIVTYRTFRHTRREQDRAYELSRSQQVTESYAKAVEQLGHAEAPVRLGAMYSLERLAQDNPPRRQTIVDVLCAYLRMPYTPSPTAEQPRITGTVPHGRWGDLLRISHRRELHEERRRQQFSAPRPDPAQELLVRQTAQDILAAHLCRLPDLSHEDPQRIEPSPEEIWEEIFALGIRRDSHDNPQRIEPSPQEMFWPGIKLDLTRASLVGVFDLSGMSVIGANFTKATFAGTAAFIWATFAGDARFEGATFSRDARFEGATFSRDARFTWATFAGDARFAGATFSRDAGFEGATFSRDARFDGATFSSTRFGVATFGGDAGFHWATFSHNAWFEGATFSRDAGFTGVTFGGDAVFHWATFAGDARFAGATFSRDAGFDGVTFGGDARFDGVRVLHLDDPDPNKGVENARRVWPEGWLDDLLNKGGRNAHRVWPEGWSVCPDADDPSRGTLVPAADKSH